MLKTFFDEIDKLINDELHMPEAPLDKVNAGLGLIVPTRSSKGLKTPRRESRNYKITPDGRILTVNNENYTIPDFFNVENLMNGDFKTLDYVFTYFGLDYDEFSSEGKRVRLKNIYSSLKVLI